MCKVSNRWNASIVTWVRLFKYSIRLSLFILAEFGYPGQLLRACPWFTRRFLFVRIGKVGRGWRIEQPFHWLVAIFRSFGCPHQSIWSIVFVFRLFFPCPPLASSSSSCVFSFLLATFGREMSIRLTSLSRPVCLVLLSSSSVRVYPHLSTRELHSRIVHVHFVFIISPNRRTFPLHRLSLLCPVHSSTCHLFVPASLAWQPIAKRRSFTVPKALRSPLHLSTRLLITFYYFFSPLFQFV